MRRQGVRPSRVTYTAAVAGLNRPRYSEWGPKLEKLARLLHDRRGDGEREPEGGEGGDGPSPEDFDCSIEALGDAGDAGGAACLLRVMRQEGFHASPRAYRSVIYACARVGHLSEAMALAKEMQSSSSAAFSGAAKRGGGSSSRPVLTGAGSSSSSSSSGGVLFEARGNGVRDDDDGGRIAGRMMTEAARAGEGTRKEGELGEERGVEQGVGVEDGEREEEGEAGEEGGEQLARRLQLPTPTGAVAEGDPDDESEFDITVVYNCIISNFARAATRLGASSSSSSSSEANGNGGYVDICEHRTGRTSTVTEGQRGSVGTRYRGAAVVGAAAKEAGVASAPVIGDRNGGGDDRSVAGGGDGLVALLLGVTERAEGSLADEGANGGVEVAAEEDAPPSVHP